MNGIKELKILGQDDAYQERFAKYSLVYARNSWMSATLSAVPRYVIESMAFGSVILLVIYLLATHQDFKDALPLMALYAFTGYRLLPAFQQIFGSATTVRYNVGSLEAVEDKLKTLVRAPVAAGTPSPSLPAHEEIGPVRRDIVLQNLVFQYATAATPLLNHLNLAIQRNTTVAHRRELRGRENHDRGSYFGAVRTARRVLVGGWDSHHGSQCDVLAETSGVCAPTYLFSR